MKQRLIFSIFAVLLVFSPSAFAGSNKVKKALRFLGVSVSSPLAEQLAGVRVGSSSDEWIERYNMVFRNMVPAPVTISVIAFEKEIARIGPGGAAVDNRIIQVHNEEVPVLGVCEDNSGRYIGVAWGKLSQTSGQTGSKPFEFFDCLTPDGSWLVRDRNRGFFGYGSERLDYPIPPADLEDRDAHLPRKVFGGTNGLQAFNASYLHAAIRINGRLLKVDSKPYLGPAPRFEYLEWNIFGVDVVRSIQVDYLEVIGGQPYLRHQWRSENLYLSASGIRGKQLIIGPPSFGVRLE